MTAKHVLKDADGSFLKEVKLRVNLKDGKGSEFILGIPVSGAQGKLIWFHDDDNVIDIAAMPFLPDEKTVEFKAISVSISPTRPC